MAPWDNLIRWLRRRIGRLYGRWISRRAAPASEQPPPPPRFEPIAWVMNPPSGPASRPDIVASGLTSLTPETQAGIAATVEGVPFRGPAEARLRRMRRAAVADVFDQLGLGAIPAFAWGFTDGADEIDAGLRTFFARLGLNPEAVAAGGHSAREEANALLDILVDVASAMPRLSETERARVGRDLFAGDFELTMRTGRLVSAAERLYQLGRSQPTERRLRQFEHLLEPTNHWIGSALDLRPDATEAVTETAERIAALMVTLTDLTEKIETLAGQVNASWPSTWNKGRRAELRASTAERFSELLNELTQRDDLTIDLIDERLGDLNDCAATYEGFIADLDRRHRRSERSRQRRLEEAARREALANPPLSARDRALKFFGFGPGEYPPRGDIQKAWRVFLRQNNPDLGNPSPEERQNRQRALKEGSLHHYLLRA